MQAVVRLCFCIAPPPQYFVGSVCAVCLTGNLSPGNSFITIWNLKIYLKPSYLSKIGNNITNQFKGPKIKHTWPLHYSIYMRFYVLYGMCIWLVLDLHYLLILLFSVCDL